MFHAVLVTRNCNYCGNIKNIFVFVLFISWPSRYWWENSTKQRQGSAVIKSERNYAAEEEEVSDRAVIIFTGGAAAQVRGAMREIRRGAARSVRNKSGSQSERLRTKRYTDRRPRNVMITWKPNRLNLEIVDNNIACSAKMTTTSLTR